MTSLGVQSVPVLAASGSTVLDAYGPALLALVLLLHVWLLVVGLAYWQDSAKTGIAWIDRRVHVSPRLYAVLMLAATVVVWLSLLVPGTPLDSELLPRRARGGLFVFAVGGLLVGAGFYLFGGVLTNLRPYFRLRRTKPTVAGDVDPVDGLVQVSGRVRPAELTLTAPVSGSETVCYQLSRTRTRTTEAEGAADSTPRRSETSTSPPSSRDPLSTFVDETHTIADERVPFVLEDETGRVAVDPTDAQLRLERTAAEHVPADERPSDRLASYLVESTDDDLRTDQTRIYCEATLECGTEVTVLGIATEGERGDSSLRDDSRAPTATITAGESVREVIVAPGCETETARHFRGAIVWCGLGGVALIGVGLWLLGVLGGPG